MIRPIIIITLIITIFLAGSAIATIEKETSPKKKQTEVRPEDSLAKPDQPSDRQPVLREESKPKNPQEYDNFIDENNDGIDDRAEKKQEGDRKILKRKASKNNGPGIQKIKTDSPRRTTSSGDSLVKKKSR